MDVVMTIGAARPDVAKRPGLAVFPVTGETRRREMRPGQRKLAGVVSLYAIRGFLKSADRMTGCAVGRLRPGDKLPLVEIRVTVHTSRMRHGICQALGVTFLAVDRRVPALQRPPGEAVVKLVGVQDLLEGFDGMALLARLAKFSFMHVLVARCTLRNILSLKLAENCRCGRGLHGPVTCGAVDALVPALERIRRLAVIE
jgi:hypothetical protein